MKDNRPVNLDIGSMRLPITAWASITHRASGVFLFAAMAFLIWALDMSLRSPESFAALQDILTSPVARLILLVIMAALIYHSLAGVRHLVMDFGIGESLEGGTFSARLVIVLSIVLTLLAGLWIW
ncbi:succinate dehydrogenase, cytochrome b556 subunit [Kineobactrum sediminis]|uniref:Succinate dehydrogenase cytochrome b556 subunit n=1 Tax=Kineobactrum sediminis TaxID=1905677 RepID=A0A2N5Y4E9_9GAMM|nr:succinate dehydrogenase, cytochrome b556 subunit [Kineobactrum sediminis]PLW83276.1 succinate dehydrogenase, cytochrome b556 subunit [Kineobactrum sediminis]